MRYGVGPAKAVKPLRLPRWTAKPRRLDAVLRRERVNSPGDGEDSSLQASRSSRDVLMRLSTRNTVARAGSPPTSRFRPASRQRFRLSRLLDRTGKSLRFRFNLVRKIEVELSRVNRNVGESLCKNVDECGKGKSELAADLVGLRELQTNSKVRRENRNDESFVARDADFLFDFRLCTMGVPNEETPMTHLILAMRPSAVVGYFSNCKASWPGMTRSGLLPASSIMRFWFSILVAWKSGVNVALALCSTRFR